MSILGALKHRFVTVNILWISVALFLVLIIANLLPVPPNDYWWYVRLGGDILQRGSLPLIDTYSWTQAGAPVTYNAWLAAVLLAWLNSAGGMTLVVLVRGLCVGAFFTLVWLSAWELGSGPRLAALFTVLAAAAASNNWAVRPQMFAYPLFGFTLWLLIRWQKGDSRGLWLLPVAALLWMNLHGSVFLIFALAGAALLLGKGPRKPLLIASGLAVLATFINPQGPAAWINTAGMMVNPSIQEFMSEWAPPVNSGWQNGLFFGGLLLFPLLAAFSPRKLTHVEWVWFIGLGWMALTGQRHVIWFTALLGVYCAVLLAARIGERPARLPRATIPAANIAISALLLVMPLAMLPGARQAWWQAAPPTLTEDTPVKLVEWLKAHPELEGPIWNEMGFGSYLIYALPERPVSMDTRIYPYTVAQLETYVQVNEAAPGWEDALRASGAQLVLVNRAGQPKLAAALDGSDGWRLIYSDSAGLIYQKQ